MRKLLVVFLSICFVLSMTVPAAAAAVDNLDWIEPSTPSGFSYYTSVNRNTEVDAFINGTTLTLTGFIPGMGSICAIIGISQGFAELFDDDSLPVRYIDHIYEANNPEAQYGVPYVYWHKLEYTFTLSDGSSYSRWSDYYEYAVAPR